MQFSCNRLLVLAPHTDDAELGCGATISRFLADGMDVHVAAFSTAEDSLPPGSYKTTLLDEFLQSMAILGVPEKNCRAYNYPVRRFASHRQEVLDTMIELRRLFKPDVVLGPASSDIHQDHQVIYAEGLRAFKDMTIFGYELPWNQINFRANAFVIVEQRHVDAKWTALRAYVSQLELGRPYFTEDFIKGLARVRGTQVKTDFAEAFELVKIRI